MPRRAIGAGALALLGAVGCATMTGYTPLPKSQDVEMGRAYASEVDKQLPIERDPATTGEIARIGRKLLDANGIKDYEFEFKVVRDDKTVNAFALPGGKIYVYTGLIARAEDEAEVAGVLGHEIGHVTERHSAERLTDAVGLETLQKVLLGNRGALTQTAAKVATQVGFLHFSRGQESEADRTGLAYITNTEYDPHGLVRFFEKMKALQGKTSSVERFVATHPDPGERAKEVAKRIRKLPPDRQTGERYAANWNRYRAHVVGGGALRSP